LKSVVSRFRELDQTQTLLAGGKGANLGELSKIAGLAVPDGFCVSTDAYKTLIGTHPLVGELLERLAALPSGDRHALRQICSQLRAVIEGVEIPEDLADEVARHLSRLGDERAYAVRSSATSEDSPTASFAGQYETHLNLKGKTAILSGIKSCWASLFSERAVSYRIQSGFDHRDVHLAVVVQPMVFPQAAGTLFTADPVTSHRKVTTLEAGFGLGEALVSGRVNADRYKVRDGRVISKALGSKTLAVRAAKNGGTEVHAIAPDMPGRQVLTDEQVLRLARLGRTIEAHFGQPQDIEWCLADDTFHILQSRPITTLFPIPEASDDAPHVYVSVGHQQMMTDPLKPLGLSFFLLTAARPMATAGGRLFVDVYPELASPLKRHSIVEGLGKSDPLIKDALLTLVNRGDLFSETPQVESPTDAGNGKPNGTPNTMPTGRPTLSIDDPAIVSELITRSQVALAELKDAVRDKSGLALLDVIFDDLRKLRAQIANPQSLGVIMTAMSAAFWINEKMNEWLGETNAADALSLSVPGNVTSEMGLALLDVADAIRPYPEVVACLRDARDERFLDELATREGGPQAREAIEAFLETYGMRCTGEIDLTRTRWSEKPTTLIPMILGNLSNVAPHASRSKFARGQQVASRKANDLLARVRELPDGENKAQETKRKIDLIRNLSGYREYPKYAIVNHYFVYKQALMREAQRLVEAKVIQQKEDIFYLNLDELREVIRTREVDEALIRQRKADFARFEKLSPPRVLTSEGEVVTGAYRRDHLPAEALAGLPVSSGVIEGRARVILDLEGAELEEGDILVTVFTDPSWTPLFVGIKGLVTEVGGLMTHGAVIAREYGLPAVIGVENATRLIADGQRIRVNGSAGYVELL